MAREPRIPVVMYHTVGVRQDSWLWADLTIGLELFEKQIMLLKRHGYHSLLLDDLRQRQETGTCGRKREVVLTFDDGYLDNWVFAYPILKREGWRGTIYVNPEFIDPSEEPRATLEDVWQGNCRFEDLQMHGFLNRAELRLLQESGVMAIGSHSMSHTWYPTSAEIVDFHRPDLDTPWLAWNARPDRKFAYLSEDQRAFVPYGHPVHAHGRSLGIRRFFPDPGLAPAAIAWVAENGGETVFRRDGWAADLRAAVAPYATEGHLESNAEMQQRFQTEIVNAKQILTDIVGTEVVHFCWPGGAYRPESWPLASAAGHRTICVARKDKARWNDTDPALVRRIGSSDFVTFRGRRYATADPRFLLWACEVELGRDWRKWPLRLQKAITAWRDKS